MHGLSKNTIAQDREKKTVKISMCWRMCLQLSPSLSSCVASPMNQLQKRNKKGTESNVLHYASLSKVLRSEGQRKPITYQTCSFSHLSFLILSIIILNNTTKPPRQFVDHHHCVSVNC